MTLKGRRKVSSRSLATSLCGVFGLHGSTGESSLADPPKISRCRYHTPSPSIIAKRSAAISKSPSALTAVMLGKEGTLKYSPGGKASKKKISKVHSQWNQTRIPACIFWIDNQVLADERRFVAYFDREEQSYEKIIWINNMILRL